MNQRSSLKAVPGIELTPGPQGEVGSQVDGVIDTLGELKTFREEQDKLNERHRKYKILNDELHARTERRLTDLEESNLNLVKRANNLETDLLLLQRKEAHRDRIRCFKQRMCLWGVTLSTVTGAILLGTLQPEYSQGIVKTWAVTIGLLSVIWVSA